MSNSKNYKKFLAVSISAAVAGSVAMPAVVGAQTTNLTDIDHLKASTTDNFYEAVTTLAGKGVIKGYPDGTFRPYVKVTRGQAAAMLARLFGYDKKTWDDPGFDDVPGHHRFHNDIAALYAKGIIHGVTEKTFKPEDPIQRNEMAKMLANAFGLKENREAAGQFTDIRKGSWYEGYVGALLEHGITQGKTATTYDPDSHVTRVQYAAFIYRADNMDEEKPGEENKDPNEPKDPNENNDPKDPGNEQEETDTLTAPKIAIYQKGNLVENVLDIVDLSEDVPVRIDIANTGAKKGDTLHYTISSDSGSEPKEVVLTDEHIARGYVEIQISTDVLRNVLGSLLSLDGLLSGVLASSVDAAAADSYVAATTLTADDPEVQAALSIPIVGDLLDGLLGGLLGDILGNLGGENGPLGQVLGSILSGVTDEDQVAGTLLGNVTDLLGVDLGNSLTGVVGLVEGVVLEVVDGVIVGVLPGNEDGNLGIVSLVDELLGELPIVGGEDGLVSGLLGSVLGGEDDLLGSVLGSVLGGEGASVGTLLEAVLEDPTEILDVIFSSTDILEGLIGADLFGDLTGQIELLDGVLAIVKDGKILDIVTGVLDVDGLLSGAEKVTITAHLENEEGISPKASKTYQFQITDLLNLDLGL